MASTDMSVSMNSHGVWQRLKEDGVGSYNGFYNYVARKEEETSMPMRKEDRAQVMVKLGI